MSEQSAFSKKKLKTINIEKRDWMEELNLPPQLIKFLRENTRALQLGGVLLVVLILAYNGGHYYFGHVREKSTELLTQANKIEDQQDRKTALEGVVSKYGSSDAGLWARIELAQLSYGEGKFDAAVDYYKGAIHAADDDSSIMPLLHYGLAIALEQKREFASAAEQFNKMREFKGFERQAWLGLGRISEKEDHMTAAINAYDKVLSIDQEGNGSGNNSGNNNDWLAEKVRSLKASVAASAHQDEAAVEK